MEDIPSASPASQQLSPALAPGGSFHGPTSTREREAGALLRRWKRGDVHPVTGRIFWSRVRDCVGGEYWVSPEKYQSLHEGDRAYQLAAKARQAERYLKNKANPSFVEKRRARTRNRYWSNPERFRKESREYYHTNKARVKLKSLAWRRANAERLRQKAKKEYRENPTRFFEYAAARRALKKGAPKEAGASAAFMRQFYITARRISRCLGIPFHVDHLRPLSKGGPHHENNLQVIPGVLNIRKGSQWSER